MQGKYRSFWEQNKAFSLSLITTITLLIWLVLSTFYLYSNLRAVSGKIESFSFERNGSKYILKLKLSGDNRQFYQKYEKRFKSLEIGNLVKNKEISFYATPWILKQDRPWLAKGYFQDFYYFPVFSINNSKNLLETFLFSYYQPSIANMLLALSMICSLLFGFVYILHGEMSVKIFVAVLLLVSLWLSY